MSGARRAGRRSAVYPLGSISGPMRPGNPNRLPPSIDTESWGMGGSFREIGGEPYCSLLLE